MARCSSPLIWTVRCCVSGPRPDLYAHVGLGARCERDTILIAMSQRLLTPLLLAWALSACRNGEKHGTCDNVVCPVELECRAGTCRPAPSRIPDAAVSGEPDAQLATNEVTTIVDAAMPS